ncbi:anti-phage dCTP deaminase [Sorangium sp. So ce861]|uniref:anti-phage dCTP deaminase n=1 Tax=Sorangium sp. So ce861 TaxID=3133323 RepID=UPI003F63BCB6
MANPQPLVQLRTPAREAENSQQVLRKNAANELIIAVVGHVGSGTSTVAMLLKDTLEKEAFEVAVLKASEEIRTWAKVSNKELPDVERRNLQYAQSLQDLGDAMRHKTTDHAAVARALIRRIRETRSQKLGREVGAGDAIMPDGARRAYILDSLRHPSEVYLLRNVYQAAFALIGVVCDEEERIDRLTGKYRNAGRGDAVAFMERDSKAAVRHGQRVEEAFHLSDYFLDNSAPQFTKDRKPNKGWVLPDQLSRFVKIVTHKTITRPNISETAMYAAAGAQRRSACLSRQVGAALVDKDGNLAATGTNEVPKAGGGVYGQGFVQELEEPLDERCVNREHRICSNTLEQNKIQDQIVNVLIEFLKDVSVLTSPATEKAIAENQEALKDKLRSSRIGGLLEFSRAVHAEMDALLSAARKGVSPVGARVFVTTYPCHYCARHLVSAGVDEVQYIEPYPKSKALSLHDDSITIDRENWEPPSRGGSKVLFRPFTGVAPRLYARAFLKDRELKDPRTGEFRMGEPDWGTPWEIGRLSYIQLEAELANPAAVDEG